MLKALVLITAFIAGLSASSAQNSYPSRPIKLVIPFAAGGGTDVVARLIANDLTKSLGQQVIVENKTGASGTLGVDAVAKARPDGYTFGVATISPLAVVPYIDNNTPYDPARDLEFVGRIAVADFIICGRPDMPYKDLSEFLKFASENPEKTSYASVGAGSVNHILQEEMARRVGAKMVHVPFGGESPIIPALMTGQVDIGLVTASAAASFIRDGKLKALAAGGPKRTDLFPELVTAEEGMKWPGYSAYTATVLVAPKETPKEILHRINTAVNEALAKPEIRDRMAGLSLTGHGGGVDEAQAFINSEISKFKELIALNKIKRQ